MSETPRPSARSRWIQIVVVLVLLVLTLVNYDNLVDFGGEIYRFFN